MGLIKATTKHIVSYVKFVSDLAGSCEPEPVSVGAGGRRH